MQPHVLEVIGTHVLVREEVDSFVGVDGISDSFDVVGFVLSCLLGGFGECH